MRPLGWLHPVSSSGSLQRMSSRVDKLHPDSKSPRGPTREPVGSAGRFDKAFQVFLEGERGVAAGVGRNITDAGMFIETREAFPLGPRGKETFPSPSRRGR